jgi:hypothetical protein
MIAFGHTALGVMVGVSVANFYSGNSPIEGLAVASGAAIVSHYLADAIPHGHFFKGNEYKKKILGVIIFDVFLSIALFTGLAYFKYGMSIELLYILIGIGASQLPDVLDGLIFMGIIPNKGLFKIEHEFQQGLHWHGQGNKTLLIGKRDIWQAAVVILALLFIVI